MKIVDKNQHVTIIDMVGALRASPEGYYAIHFHLSKLMGQYKSDYQIKIAINILADLFKGNDCILFLMPNLDLMALYHGNDRGLLEKSIFQLRYLFMDDPLSYTNDGFENADFCSVYDLEFQWQDFFKFCRQTYAGDSPALENADNSTKAKATKKEAASSVNAFDTAFSMKRFTPSALDGIIKKIDDVEIEKVLRHQPICAWAKSAKKPKRLYDETFFHIATLRECLGIKTDLLSDHSLFKHLTLHLDKKLLQHHLTSKAYLSTPFCININLQSLVSDLFIKLDKLITPSSKKKSVIFEVHVSDVFENMGRFMAIRDAIKKEGYQLCIDGLDDISIMHIDPIELGFNLTKLQWNPRMQAESNKKNIQALAERITKIKPNRIILCRCDNQDAIDYGRSLGISLFQGWHIDHLLADA